MTRSSLRSPGRPRTSTTNASASSVRPRWFVTSWQVRHRNELPRAHQSAYWALSAIAPTCRALNHAVEKQKIEDAIAPLKQGGLVELDWLPLANTTALLQAMLKQYHIVHYIGHGAFDPVRGLGTLAFDKKDPDLEDLSAHQFYRNLGSKVGFVFLNACDSGHEVGGIAEELVRRGIPAVLGMRRSVLDSAAIQFASMFYRALADGWPVDAALVEGRIAMINSMDDDDTNDQWSQPILYMRPPDGRIFQ